VFDPVICKLQMRPYKTSSCTAGENNQPTLTSQLRSENQSTLYKVVLDGTTDYVPR